MTTCTKLFLKSDLEFLTRIRSVSFWLPWQPYFVIKKDIFKLTIQKGDRSNWDSTRWFRKNTDLVEGRRNGGRVYGGFPGRTDVRWTLYDHNEG